MIRNPVILTAINPLYALDMFIHSPWVSFVALGAVVLAVTGCEAIYADMGHFGRKPIQYAWLFLALPVADAELFRPGRGAAARSGAAAHAFFAPFRNGRIGRWWGWRPWPPLLPAQAVITGVFSMTQQAVQLGQLPRMEVAPHQRHRLWPDLCPRVNLLLCDRRGPDGADLQEFRSLLAAYGIAVTGVMVIDTFNAGLVASKQWRWPTLFVIFLFGAMGLSDFILFIANALKILRKAAGCRCCWRPSLW